MIATVNNLRVYLITISHSRLPNQSLGTFHRFFQIDTIRIQILDSKFKVWNFFLWLDISWILLECAEILQNIRITSSRLLDSIALWYKIAFILINRFITDSSIRVLRYHDCSTSKTFNESWMYIFINLIVTGNM